MSLLHHRVLLLFFFHAPPPTEIYTLSLHDALPISRGEQADAGEVIGVGLVRREHQPGRGYLRQQVDERRQDDGFIGRSEEHTSELQSHSDLVCRLLLEKKKKDRQRTKD